MEMVEMMMETMEMMMVMMMLATVVPGRRGLTMRRCTARDWRSWRWQQQQQWQK